MSLINKLSLIQNHPIIAIATSEVISYTIPFISNSPLYAFNNMILFIFYMVYYNKSGNDVINKFLIKNFNYYLIEFITISILFIFIFQIKTI